MCGIAVVIAPSGQSQPTNSGIEHFQSLVGCDCGTLLRRGPDSWFQTSITPFGLSSSPVQLLLLGSVLSQRGNSTTLQPLHSESTRNGSTYALLWNGEIYAHTEEHTNSLFINPCNNDGEVLLSLLAQTADQAHVLSQFSSLFGPFAFILLEVHQMWVELPASGVFSGHLRLVDQGWCIADITLHPWSPEHSATFPSFGLSVARIASPLAPLVDNWLERNVHPSQDISQTLLDLLSSAVKDRVCLASSSCSDCFREILQPPYQTQHACTHSRFAVLFSGGIDSTILAVLCHRHVPRDQPIDLINVAFEQSGSHKLGSQGKPVLQPASKAPDRRTAWQSFHELCRVAPTRRWKLVLADVSSAELHSVRTNYIKELLLPGRLTVLDDSLGLAMWFAARGRGRCCEAPKSDLEVTENLYTSPAKTVFVGTGVDEQLAGYTRHRAIYTHRCMRELSCQSGFQSC
ncbi:unnamed protein product [Dicrocoelium dendriticum]|nr:unnamed protein product [Dicrocoelium dendriticum]